MRVPIGLTVGTEWSDLRAGVAHVRFRPETDIAPHRAASNGPDGHGSVRPYWFGEPRLLRAEVNVRPYTIALTRVRHG